MLNLSTLLEYGYGQMVYLLFCLYFKGGKPHERIDYILRRIAISYTRKAVMLRRK